MNSDSGMVHHPDAAHIVAALDALAAGEVAAVDADGTLWNIDVGDELMRCVAKHTELWRGRVDTDAYFREFAHDHRTGAPHSAYAVGLVDGDDVCRVLHAALEPIIQPRRYLVDAIVDAVRRAVTVVVVSASPDVALLPPLRLIGLSELPRIGAVPDPAGGLPDVADLPVGTGKVTQWKARSLPVPNLAIGDSPWDVPLLKFAHSGILIGPFKDDPFAAVAAMDLR